MAYSEGQKIEALSLVVERGLTIQAAADATGIPRKTISNWYNMQVRAGVIASPPIPVMGRPPHGFAVRQNNAEYDADGTLRRQWVSTKPDSGEVYETPAGHVVKAESALIDADGRVMQRWVKTTRDGSD